ncbi:MAG TPA: AraC family transcriptional regulator [Micropepsaceae bacterium]|nr:AraC family transcriptional regulator [Micropepsaceae bacterium]
MWEGASLWIMEAIPAAGNVSNTTDFHSHHAVQVTLSLGGRFELRTRDQRISSSAAVAPDVSHIFEAVGCIAILFVEPESRSGRAIIQSLFKSTSLAPIPSDLVGDLIERLKLASGDANKDDASLIVLGRSFVARLAGLVEPELPDPRVQKIAAYVASRLDDPITLAAAAKSVGLSPGRVRHLFVEQTGLPFRNYLLWLRIMKAVGVFAGGASLTKAAHEAGFADSAHFSRTFRRMFGIKAAALRII